LVLAGLALGSVGAFLEPASVAADGQLAAKRRLAGQPVVCTAKADAALLREQILYVDDAARPSVDCGPVTIAGVSSALPGASGWRFAPNDLARALATTQGGEPGSNDLHPDLVRARSVGAPTKAIVVDNASARLWMLENGRVIDSMKVIVGKPGMATPEMAGRITYATLNPYWNIPPDIVRASVGPKARSVGPAFLEQQRFELVDRYGLSAQRVDPATVNWDAVIAGTQKVGVRQLPGGSNMMGAVKFIFPNNLGIYLHDTPQRAAFERTDRRISSGCVRVERAADLYRWMFRDDLHGAASRPEQRMVLREPVPVYLFRFSPSGAAAIDRAFRSGLAEPTSLS
jgi:hypothetical protein